MYVRRTIVHKQCFFHPLWRMDLLKSLKRDKYSNIFGHKEYTSLFFNLKNSWKPLKFISLCGKHCMNEKNQIVFVVKKKLFYKTRR